MLDIIIPTYNNINGLFTTLSSIPKEILNKVTVTVIDDHSYVDYTDITNWFPFINFSRMDKNRGPGVVRQRGIDSTMEPYIVFIDTGDLFVENVFDEVFSTIAAHPEVDIFSYKFLLNGNCSLEDQNNLHGRIYKREFLNKYNITFSELGSYANEDIGFNHLCRLIINHFYPDGSHVYLSDKPLVIYDIEDLNSITRGNGHTFLFTKQNIGMAYNAIHAYNSAAAAGVSQNELLDYASNIMSSQYFFFMRTLEDKPEYAQYAWDGARYFYLNLFKKLPADTANKMLSYSRIIRYYKKLNEGWEPKFPINIYRFLHFLEETETVPAYYLTF